MSRVLVIGSSHVGAYKNAAAAFAAKHSGIALDFFGLRGPQFRTGRVDADGRFAPVLKSPEDRDFVLAVNGQLDVDTRQFDHVLVVGPRFAFGRLAAALESHAAVSESMIRQAANGLITDAVAEATGAFANCTTPLTFAPAPYPATSILERGDSFPLARTLGLFWARRDAQKIFDVWKDAVGTALASRGYAFLTQPDTLNAGPHATKPEFAARAHGLDGDKTGKTDHRHMNADYGLAMLCALADTSEGLGANKARSTPDQREDA